VAYWVIPRATGAPLWSHTLSLIGFWTILAIYTHTGGHHLLQAPVPTWIKVLAVVDSICMLIPVFTFLANVWLPLRDRWGRLHADVGLKLVFAGTVFYAITCVQGPLQSLPSIQRVTHFTHWVVAHAHLAVFGFGGMIAMGTIYSVLPLVTGRKVWSLRLAEVQYWVMLTGVVGFFVVLTGAGLLQGHAWLNGEMVYRVLPELTVYMVLRGAVGVAVTVGACLQLFNVVMTLYFGRLLRGTRGWRMPACRGGRERSIMRTCPLCPHRHSPPPSWRVYPGGSGSWSSATASTSPPSSRPRIWPCSSVSSKRPRTGSMSRKHSDGLTTPTTRSSPTNKPVVISTSNDALSRRHQAIGS
jgi:heme/copper-type cytochrome/quinol oxidase subunit 1